MPDFAKTLDATKGAATLLVLFIPSRDRSDKTIDQHYWVDESLKTLGALFEEVILMAKNIKKIAEGLGAKIVAQVPNTGGGAFGAARLCHVVETLHARLLPSQGRRVGRPTDASWERHPKVPMSRATEQRLAGLAERASTGPRKVSPMQLAAQLLEHVLSEIPD